MNMIAQHFTQDFSFNSVVGAEQKYSQGQFTKTVKIKYSVSEVWVFPSFLSFFLSISVICLPTSTVDSTVAVKLTTQSKITLKNKSVTPKCWVHLILLCFKELLIVARH